MMTTDARVLWNTLKGIICVYKPAEYSVRRLRTLLINKICTELNKQDCRPPINYVSIEGDPQKQLSVVVKPNLADHTLVVGPRYQEEDLVISWSNFLGWNTSGVLLFGLRSGTKTAKFIRENRSTRAYKIKGMFGLATDNCFKSGKIVERSTWRHVRGSHLEKLLSSMQASHQKKMFEMCGIDMQSQTAYELAIKGPIRPINTKVPIIYGIKCTEFQPPHFTLEIQCVNEYESYLSLLVHDIGVQLHSTAHCTGLQCIRHSYFNLEHAMLTKHFNLQNILSNVEMCNKILEENDQFKPQTSANLV